MPVVQQRLLQKYKHYHTHLMIKKKEKKTKRDEDEFVNDWWKSVVNYYELNFK